MSKLQETVKDREALHVAMCGFTKSQLIGKDTNAGKDSRQEEKVTTEDEMAGWHHRLNGREWGCRVGHN